MTMGPAAQAGPILRPDPSDTPTQEGLRVSRGVSRLDDEDYPAVTMGQAAELLEVQPAFLRSLDAAGVLTPYRSGGGHRRYSRRQLAVAARMRALFDEGLNLDAATRIVSLENELADARAQIAELERRVAQNT
jgi:MerR family transcriptional regulator, heat shock protein HspR